MPKKKDLAGIRFGSLVAVRDAGKKNGSYVWECMCDCGNVTFVCVRKLSNGHTRSCGCLRRDGTRKPSYNHGLSNTRLYRIWCNLKTRCLNPHSDNYAFYGGKGVSVCEEWLHDFQTFYDWAMGNGYEDNLTIDRKDSNGDYCPQNCQWITQSENATRANVKRWAASAACKK